MRDVTAWEEARPVEAPKLSWKRFAIVARCTGCGTYSQQLKSIVWRTALRDLQTMLRWEQEALLTRHPLTERQLDALAAFTEEHQEAHEWFRGNLYGHPAGQIELHVMRHVIQQRQLVQV